MAFLGVMPKSPEPASAPVALSVEGPTPTPSVSPRGNVTLGRGAAGGRDLVCSSWGYRGGEWVGWVRQVVGDVLLGSLGGEW